MHLDVRSCAVQIPFLAFAASIGSCLIGCQSTTVGTISRGRYWAPGGTLSVSVPELSGETMVEDHFVEGPDGERGGFVSFHDSFGHLRRVDYAEFLAQPVPVTDEAMERFVREEWLPRFQASMPGTRLLSDSPMTIDGVPTAWFARLEIPEGSAMVELSEEHPEGKRKDSTRGFLLLFEGDLYLLLSVASDVVGASEEDMKEALRELHASVDCRATVTLA
jgi:hypothetical protein